MMMKTVLLISVLTTLYPYFGQSKKIFEPITVEPLSRTIGDTVSDIGKDIDCILQDRNSNYWFASNGNGLYRFDGKILTHITKKDGLCSDYVLSIQQDVNGNLWFTTRDGICSYNGINFTDYTNKIDNAPYRKMQYTNGCIFFGRLNSVCLYDGKSFTNFVIHPDNYHPAPNDMSRPYSIYSILIDKEENVWFGTQSQGVCRYDGKKITYLTDKNLAGYAVRTLFQDREGNLWFGNNGGGLFRYDGKTLTNITEEKGLGNPEFLKGHFSDKLASLARVWTINEDKEGNLWVGTIDAGVWKFDGTNLMNYTVKDGLTGNSIWGIFKDNMDELWFITNGDAICKLNGKTFTKFAFRK